MFVLFVDMTISVTTRILYIYIILYLSTYIRYSLNSNNMCKFASTYLHFFINR